MIPKYELTAWLTRFADDTLFCLNGLSLEARSPEDVWLGALEVGSGVPAEEDDESEESEQEDEPKVGDLFLSYKDVDVYQTLTDTDAYSSTVFTTAGSGVSWHASNTFSVTELPAPAGEDLAKYQELFPDDFERQVLAFAIDTGRVHE